MEEGRGWRVLRGLGEDKRCAVPGSVDVRGFSDMRRFIGRIPGVMTMVLYTEYE